MKKLAVICSLVMLIVFVSASAYAKVILRYAHSNAVTHPYHIAGLAFAKAVEERTRGAVEVRVFPMGQLGGERDVTEGLQLGTIDLQGTSFGVTGTFVRVVNIYNLPFIFRGTDHFMRVTHGPLGRWVLGEAAREGEKVNLKVLSLAGPSFRVPMNNVRPITRLEDFKGLRIRTMEVPLHRDTYSSLGASPVPLPFGEVYTALQTGVVDGNENGPASLRAMRFYEVQKFVSNLPVVSNGGVFLMSLRSFNKLSPEHQKAIVESIPVWARAMDEEYLRQDREAFGYMEGKGITVHHFKDITPFVTATAPARVRAMKGWPKEWEEVVERIIKLD